MLRIAALLTAATLATPAAADGREVDLELVLMVDVSRSMSDRELEIQRRGYAAALRSEEVYAAVRSGLLQRIAATYVEWADTQEVIVPWRLLESREDLDGFAASLVTNFDPTFRRTSISEALVFGAASINSNAYTGLRRVIDISGDGPNNRGRTAKANWATGGRAPRSGRRAALTDRLRKYRPAASIRCRCGCGARPVVAAMSGYSCRRRAEGQVFWTSSSRQVHCAALNTASADCQA